MQPSPRPPSLMSAPHMHVNFIMPDGPRAHCAYGEKQYMTKSTVAAHTHIYYSCTNGPCTRRDSCLKMNNFLPMQQKITKLWIDGRKSTKFGQKLIELMNTLFFKTKFLCQFHIYSDLPGPASRLPGPAPHPGTALYPHGTKCMENERIRV